MTLIFASIPQDSPPILASDCLLSGGADGRPSLLSGRNEEAVASSRDDACERWVGRRINDDVPLPRGVMDGQKLLGVHLPVGSV